MSQAKDKKISSILGLYFKMIQNRCADMMTGDEFNIILLPLGENLNSNLCQWEEEEDLYLSYSGNFFLSRVLAQLTVCNIKYTNNNVIICNKNTVSFFYVRK